MDLIVPAHISPVYIRIYPRVNKRVVQSRIENRLVFIGASRDTDASKLPVPHGKSILTDPVELLACHFLPEILPCAVHVHERQPDFHSHLLVFRSREFREESDMFPFKLILSADNIRFADTLQIRKAHHLVFFTCPSGRYIRTPEAIVFQRMAELRVKIDGISGISVPVAPATGLRSTFHPSGNSVVIKHFDIL